MVGDLPTTRRLTEWIEADSSLRHLSGWSRFSQVSGDFTISCAFKEFTDADLPGWMHRALAEEAFCNAIVLQNSRNSTEIKVRAKSSAKTN